ncbi:MAG: DUF4175 family protein [Myxococcota bacterium]
MADDLNIIRRFVGRLVWRERVLLLLDISGRTFLLGFVSLLLVVLAALLDWDRGGTAAVLVLVGGTGLWAAIVLPLLLRWRATGDALRQARLAEAQQPELRGRLVTAVERVGGARNGESEALLGLVARRAATLLSEAQPSRIHGGMRQLVLVAVGAFLLFLPVPLSFLAGGPVGVAKWWAAGFEASAAMSLLKGDQDDPRAQVGDLVLRYTYPDYTGLEPRVIENSTGDAQGPPGTQVEVTARSADPIEAAGLVAYEQRFEARVRDSRMVDGTFTIGPETGAYHLVTWRGETSERSRDFKISAEEDLPPDVTLDGEADVLELAVDEDFQILWRARDDYGVRSVSLLIAGKPAGAPIYRMTERKAEVFGDLWRTPADLGLKPGQEVELAISATDNDTYSGSKSGTSRSIRLVVLGPKGLDARSEAQLEAMVDAMVVVLADHLEESFPVGSASKDFAQWSEVVAKRYLPVQELVDREWGRLGDLEKAVLGEVVSTGGELVRYTAVAFDPRSTEMAQPAAVSDTERYRDAAIVALEDGILALDRMLQNKALAEVVDVAERMDDLGKELEQLMAEDDPDALAMLAKLEQLEAMAQQLAEAAAKLQDGGLKEFVNARNDEMGDLMEEVRKAISEGRMDDAKKLMERLASQLQQMAEGVRDTLERQKGEGNDAMEKADELRQKLEALEQEQRELQEQVEKLREQGDEQQADAADKVWEQIQEEANELVAEAVDYRDELGPALRGFNEIQRAENGVEQAGRLQRSANGQDLRGSRAGHRAVSLAVDAMFRALQSSLITGGAKNGPARAELESMYAHLDAIQKLLDQLEQQPPNAAMAEQGQQLEQRQQEIQQQLQEAQKSAQELTQQFPVRPKGLEEGLDEADQRMGEARQDLQDGRPMPAEGSQGAAADRIQEARQALEQAMEQARQQQQQMEPSSGSRSGGEDSDESGRENNKPQNIEIPRAEEFQTPEAYRKALLEGMEGEVPEEFQAMKKRYFEELVRQ